MPDIDDLHDGASADESDDGYDVAVIGGGPAGLTAAIALVRFRRSVVVIDNGTPRNAPAGHVHNLLTRDGTPPAELHDLGHAEVQRYGGQFVAGTVRSIHGSVGAFTLQLDDQTLTAQRIIVATGGRDELPDVPGLAPRWGTDVVHWPFCHGYEVRDQRIGVLATGPTGMHGVVRGHVVTAASILRDHLAEPWTLDALADEVHLSRSQLVRSFDATVGMSPMAYLRRMRVEQMARLLVSTDLSVADAARSVGWRNQFHASQCFHAAYGIPPTEFRRQHATAPPIA